MSTELPQGRYFAAWFLPLPVGICAPSHLGLPVDVSLLPRPLCGSRFPWISAPWLCDGVDGAPWPCPHPVSTWWAWYFLPQGLPGLLIEVQVYYL